MNRKRLFLAGAVLLMPVLADASALRHPAEPGDAAGGSPFVAGFPTTLPLLDRAAPHPSYGPAPEPAPGSAVEPAAPDHSKMGHSQTDHEAMGHGGAGVPPAASPPSN